MEPRENSRTQAQTEGRSTDSWPLSALQMSRSWDTERLRHCPRLKGAKGTGQLDARQDPALWPGLGKVCQWDTGDI